MSEISSTTNCSSQVITCKAAVCWGLGEECKVEDIQVEPPRENEVRVKMLYASFCHTDITVSKGFPFPLFPRVLGHEGVGVVESVGEGVTSEEFKQGDIVIPTFLAECQECENCLSGNSNMCLKYPMILNGLMLDGTSRMSTVYEGHQKKLYQLFSCSTWSEYMVVDAIFLLKLPEWDATKPPLSHASFLSCGFSTGFGAPWKEAKVERGSTVAVIGLGAVGLGAIEGARMQGAARIFGVDINEMKREKGIAFGMTDFINPVDQAHHNKSVSELIKDATNGMGVDYCFESSGVASFVNEALVATKPGKGTAVVLGSAGTKVIEVDSLSLFGRTLKGSIFGGIRAKTDLPMVINKCINKEIQLDELLTHEIPLVDINKAFELLKKPDCVKILIKI